MRAIQSDTHGNMTGNFWRVEDDEGEELMTFAAPVDVTTEAAALALYADMLDEVDADPEPAAPARVSARQFKLQLLAAGLLDQVENWIATQDQAVQIAYANSATFVRTDVMMQAGFAELGFSPEQVDDFFSAAALL